ncbi:unnamed protein product [Adineta steineri]|uniref:Sugar phosphate transporter domain-containing protein n=1 Tax=Adineta steineri TaxID=433720 RepID=A0A813Y6B3_9BILA|nr:unnamed protein product [Adineta steineri]CAF1358708.1 unnamed protein product [Adineta steineri]
MPVTSLTETIPNKSNVFLSTEKLLLEVPQGLYHTMAILILILWYISSGATLFSNKYILSHLDGDAFLLGTSQLVVSVISGYIQMRIIHMMNNEIHRPPPIMKNVYRDMLLIGAFRCVTVILGLIALKYIAVSFLATIKSSSPLFTVVISRIMLGERTSNWTKLSMIPITIGLCLCSSFELSFELFGFLCALGTNIFDCLQNVFSKLLISGENHRYTAVELQFWASFVACIFQLPLLYYYSVAAFALMAYISPITHSVVNTVKRALLIWLSVIIFNNPITFLSGIGTLMVITGVILYNDQRDGDKKPGILNVNTATLITWRDV